MTHLILILGKPSALIEHGPARLWAYNIMKDFDRSICTLAFLTIIANIMSSEKCGATIAFLFTLIGVAMKNMLWNCRVSVCPIGITMRDSSIECYFKESWTALGRLEKMFFSKVILMATSGSSRVTMGAFVCVESHAVLIFSWSAWDAGMME